MSVNEFPTTSMKNCIKNCIQYKLCIFFLKFHSFLLKVNCYYRIHISYFSSSLEHSLVVELSVTRAGDNFVFKCKGVFSESEIRFSNLQTSKKNIPNHYPELEIWISCLLLWAGISNFKLSTVSPHPIWKKVRTLGIWNF